MIDLVARGSKTARDGFRNEYEIRDKFNNWQSDTVAQEWLTIMGYVLQEIESVNATVLHGYKSDVNVQIQVRLKRALDVENIQVKLVSSSAGFNQVDKRWLSRYQEMWNIPNDVFQLLRFYTGELPPYRTNTRDPRRMFMDEFTTDEQRTIIKWFSDNKTLVLGDIIRGRGQFSAEWVLVAQKLPRDARWVLVNINQALQHYSVGDVCASSRGNLYVGKITVQRKGGDGGRPSACMLQFKLDPTELFDTAA